MEREEFLKCLGEDYTFKIRTIAKQVAIDMGLMIRADRVKIQHVLREELPYQIIRGLFSFATLEDQVFDYPNNFLTRWGQKWQSFKDRRFPRWLRKRCPLKVNRVWATHKFPELNIPNELVGREFIHFKVVREDKLAEVGKEEKEKPLPT